MLRRKNSYCKIVEFLSTLESQKLTSSFLMLELLESGLSTRHSPTRLFTFSYKITNGRGVMAFLEEILLRTWIVVIAVIIVCVKEANAFDGGDAAALIIGLVVGILGICSCLGYYARRRGV